jgi:hypothetical protein
VNWPFVGFGMERTFRRTLRAAYNDANRDPPGSARLNPRERNMKRIGLAVVIAALACAAISGAAQSAASTAFDPPARPAIHIEDVDRFYQIYDAAGGHPTAD